MVLEALQVMNCKSLPSFWYRRCLKKPARTNSCCQWFNRASQTACPFTYTKQHAGLKTHEEVLAVYGADLSILGECFCVKSGILKGSKQRSSGSFCWPVAAVQGREYEPGQTAMRQFPSRRGRSLSSCSSKQLTYSNKVPALSNTLESGIAVPDIAHCEKICKASKLTHPYQGWSTRSS